MANMIFDVLRRANSTSYSYGDLIALSPHDGHVYMCTTAGTSAASPPTYNSDSGATTIDGEAIFTEYNPALYYASVSMAKLKLSLANGFAFIDIGVETVLTSKLNSKIVITDSAGKKAVGYIKAAGTGETYGSEHITNGGFGDTSNWIAVDCTLASVSGGESGNCLEVTRTGGTFQAAYQSYLSHIIGALYKNSAYIKSGTSGNESASVKFYNSWATGISNGSWIKYIAYGVANSENHSLALYKNTSTAGTMLFDTASSKQVLSPSTTGVTITSTPNGTTYNWASVESGFNYNDSSGYIVAVYGQLFSGAVQFTQNPRYSDYEKPKLYNQAIKRSAGGTVYSYDLGIGAVEGRVIRFGQILDTDLTLLQNFLAIVRASKFVWQFTDEAGVAHKVLITNPTDVANSTPERNGYSGDVTIEVEFVG